MNTFGRIFTLTTFGESHSHALGGVIDGVPAGIEIDLDFIQTELNRRRPGQSTLTTSRDEGDKVEFLSGIYEGRTLGTPIGFVVYNHDARPQDYDSIKDLFRPSHADYTYQEKYGLRDHRGGGRSSARITTSRCVAGAIAKLILRQKDISISAYTSQVGTVCTDHDYHHLDLNLTESNPVRCPDPNVAQKMEDVIREVKAKGDSIGGVVTCVVKGCPTGLGEPEAEKLQARLAHAMLSINATKGFEYGSGFESAKSLGSTLNDEFTMRDGTVHTTTNHSGGIQGGISNGEDIYFRVAFKPTATITLPQHTVRTDGTPTEFTAQGRHDPCVVPRAVPIVEAMTAMVLLDSLLLRQTNILL